MVSMAGHPEYVGVIVTWTRPWSSSVTSRRMPRSAIVTCGSSGSRTVAARSRARVSCITMSSPTSSPGGSRVGAVEVLHLGEQMPEVLGVEALTAAAEGSRDLGHGQRRLVDDARQIGLHALAQLGRVDDAGGEQTWRGEQLGDVRPLGVEGRPHPD